MTAEAKNEKFMRFTLGDEDSDNAGFGDDDVLVEQVEDGISQR